MKEYVLAVVALMGCKKKLPSSSQAADDDAAIANMVALKDQMCACRDKACADRVLAAMTTWSNDMAAQARKNDRKADDPLMKKMTEVGQAIGECMTKAVSAPVQAPNVVSAIDSQSEPSTRHADGLIREALGWAATSDPEMRIRHLRVAFVDRSGLLDPKFGDIDIDFGRVSIEKRRIGTPNRSAEHYCYDLSLSYGRWKRTQNPCTDTIDYVPHCKVVEIWNRALERNTKVDPEAVASIMFSPSDKVWTFVIDDEPTNLHVRETLPDDCELNVEK